MSARKSLRTLGALDLDLASRLHRQAFAPVGERPWTRQDVAELLASPGVAGRVVQIDDRDAGFALVRVVADEAELLTIAVAEDHRRRGAARTLLQAIVEHARCTGAKNLFLEVDVGNLAARALYAQLGFAEVGRRESYYERRGKPAAAALVMRLELTFGG